MRIIKFVFSFLLVVLIANSINAQTGMPSGVPITFSKGWIRYGYLQNDSGRIDAVRDTNWTPRFIPTTVYWQNAGVDTAFWTYIKTTGQRWQKQVAGSSSSGVSSISQGYGILNTPNPITSTGSVKLDSATVYGVVRNTIKDSNLLRVPYTGAINNVNLGLYGLTNEYLQQNINPVSTLQEGRMQWNNTDGTLDIRLKGNNVTLQTGQEELIRVVNKTGSNLTQAAYPAVYISGAQGQRVKVSLASANADSTSNAIIGVVTEDINVNQEGFVTVSGLIRGINTTGSLQGETWIDGDVLYLSPFVDGGLTNVLPTAPQHSVLMGYVVYAHAINGSIYIKPIDGFKLDQLHNVKITSPANNNVLSYTSATKLWENKTVASALGYVPVNIADSATVYVTPTRLKDTSTALRNLISLKLNSSDTSKWVGLYTTQNIIGAKTFNALTGYNTNLAGSYTARSFTDKNYVDSIAALKLNKADSTTAYITPTKLIDSLSTYFRKGGNAWVDSALLGTTNNKALYFKVGGITKASFGTSNIFDFGLGKVTNPEIHLHGDVSSIYPAIIFEGAGGVHGGFYDYTYRMDYRFDESQFWNSAGTVQFGGIDATGAYIGSGSRHVSAMFELFSTTQTSIPFPLMTQTQRDAIGGVTEGSMVTNTTTHAPNFYNGTSWVSLSGASSGVDTIYRTLGKDSIQFTIGGRYHAIKDSTGGGSVPSGNNGNIAFLRNGALVTAGSDSLSFTSAALSIKGALTVSALTSAAGNKQLRYNTSTGVVSTQDTLADVTFANLSHYLPDTLLTNPTANNFGLKALKAGTNVTLSSNDSSITINASGGGSVPSGNNGNIAFLRNGALVTAGSDSLSFTSAALSIKGALTVSALTSAAGNKQLRYNTSTGVVSTQDTLADVTFANLSHYLPDTLLTNPTANNFGLKALKAGTNVTLSSNDSSITINASGGSGGVDTVWTANHNAANYSLDSLKSLNILVLGAGSDTSQNLVIWSDSLSQAAAWDAVTNNLSVTDNALGNIDLLTATFGTNNLRQDVTVTAGTTYYLSLMVKRGTSTDVSFAVYDLTHFADIIPTTSYYSQTSGTLTRVIFPFTVPAGCTSVALFPVRNIDNGGTIYAGEIQLATSPTFSYVQTTTTPVDTTYGGGTSTINVLRTDTLGNVIFGNLQTTTTANYDLVAVGDSLKRTPIYTYGYVAKTANYTATANDYLIDCTSGTFNVTLPTAVGITGRVYIIKNSGSGAITVNTTSSQTIDGSTTFSLGTQYKQVSVMSNGSNFIVTNNN